MTCVKWVLDISECPIYETGFTDTTAGPNILMDPHNTKHLATVVSTHFKFTLTFILLQREPMISYKHCTFGQNTDQVDKFDILTKEDKFSPECSTMRNTQQPKMIETGPLFMDHFLPNAPSMSYLQSLGNVTFPIKNKSKLQNTFITNFMFETDKHLKQETFMLCFDLHEKLEAL